MSDDDPHKNIPRDVLGDKSSEDKVIRFPSLAQRDKLRKGKAETGKKKKAPSFPKVHVPHPQSYNQSGAKQPFFNLGHIPIVTRVLAVMFLGIHLITTMFIEPHVRFDLFMNLGFVPGYYTGAIEWSWGAFIGPISYAFLHQGWMHIGFNIVMTLALGMMFEAMLRPRGFILFFFLCSLAGAVLTFALNPYSLQPVIGASGGLSGLFAAMIIAFYDQGRFQAIKGPFARWGVWSLIGFWGLIMLGMGLGFGGIAWQAHFGGYVAGALLMTALKKRIIRF